MWNYRSKTILWFFEQLWYLRWFRLLSIKESNLQKSVDLKVSFINLMKPVKNQGFYAHEKFFSRPNAYQPRKIKKNIFLLLKTNFFIPFDQDTKIWWSRSTEHRLHSSLKVMVSLKILRQYFQIPEPQTIKQSKTEKVIEWWQLYLSWKWQYKI